jgi:quercetin dioxygenase-like cupin family protein
LPLPDGHAAEPRPPLHTTILAKSTVAPLLLRAGAEQPALWRAVIKTRGLSDVYVVDNKFGAGATTGWHSHLGPSLIFVVAGTVTNYTGDDRRCTPHSYAVGSAFVDPGGDDVHMLRNESDAPAETIAVQFLPQGATRRIDAAAPRNCRL